MTEELKVVTEVAKTTGKAIDASREVGGFISKFIAGPLEQGIGIFEDKLKYMRWEHQVAIMDKVNAKMAERGLDGPTQAVPLKITIPLLQAASMEDDNNLQDLWANLLVNAADRDNGTDVRRTYIEVLQNLTTFDAQALEKIYAVHLKGKETIGVWALPDKIIITPARQSVGVIPERPKPEVELCIENLCRLRLINSAVWPSADHIHSIYQTAWGRAFFDACSDKKTVISR